MMTLITLIAGAIVWECFRRMRQDYITPYKLSCIHCKNGGSDFIIRGTDKVLLGQIMDEHKRDVHPYAA